MDKQVEPVTQEKPVYNPRAQPPPRQILTDKVYVDWEADRFFNIRAKIVGPGGAYVKHIQQQSNVRLQLKGKGSGYTESATGRESEEPLHVWLTTTQDEEALEKAKALLQDLLSKVKADYDQWKVNRGTNTASIGYSASHAHAQERNRFNDRSHFQVPPASAPVPSMPTSTHLASAASNMVPTAPPAPTPPTTIVSTPEQYAIYHQYYQQYYQHYYQQYVMMSSMHIPQQHSMHAYMQVPPSFPPPPHTPTSSASFGYPSSSAPTTGAPTPQSTPYTSSSYPSASSPPSETRGIKEQVPSSESATDSSSLGDTNPYGAYAAYYAQSYSQSTGNPTTVLENSKSIEPSNSNEVESQETVDPEPIVEQETKRQRVE
ncbi:hypothetical protein HMI55_002501 [Coelomomyces lativittatus]|nr:hypothetical protein HMI55_002501 [Coelomomyces lativittatus]